MATVAAITATSALVVGLVPGVASAAPADAQLAVTTVGMSPSAGLAGSDGAYTLEPQNAGDQQQFAFAYTCPSDATGACVNASFTLDLANLTLVGFVPGNVTRPGAYTVTHYDTGSAPVDPGTGSPADVRRIVVTYADDVGNGMVGLVTGTTGQLLLTATVVPPLGGGDQTGGVTIVPTDDVGDGPSSTVTVTATFVPALSTTTGKSWSATGYLSGASSSSNTATIIGTNTGEPTGMLTLTDPAVPSVVPSGAESFNVLALVGLGIAAWPAGAETVNVTLWDSGVARPASGPLDQTAAALWLTALAGDTRDITGVSFAFAAPSGGRIAADAVAEIAVATEQYGSTDGVAQGRDGTAVEFSYVGGLDDDFGTLTVQNTARTVADSDVDGAQPGTSETTAGFSIVDPRPYASAAKGYTGPDGGATIGQVAIGSYAVATITATSWARQAVDSLSLVERPTQAQIDENPPALALGPLSPGMFAGTGFVFAGFGDGFATPGDPASGANADGLVWPAGTTGAVFAVTHGAPATTATVSVNAGDPLPGLADFIGLASWADVTGLQVDFTGSIPTGATGTVPYLVTPGGAAEPGVYDNHVLARTTLDGDASGVSPRSVDSGNRPIVRAPLEVEAPSVGVDVSKQIPQTHVNVAGGEVNAVLRATSRPGNSEPTRLVLDDRRTTANRWWQVMEPTSVDLTVSAGDTAQLSYWDGSTLVPYGMPHAASTTVTLPPGASTWDGLRVTYTRAAGFPTGNVVQAIVAFAVRASATGGGAFLDAETLTNCATARAEIEYNGTTFVGTSGTLCDAIVGYATTGGPGSAALVKALGGTVQEGGRGQRTATLTWGTAGRNLDSMTITDGNAIDGSGNPAKGRADSFWDTFDLVRIQAVTSGPSPSAGAAYDPFLIFDQVTAVEYFDVTDDGWKPVAAATGLPYPGTAANAGNGWTVVPSISLSAAERVVAGGVRLVVQPLADADRAGVVAALVAAGDWRGTSLADDLMTNIVASTSEPARQVRLVVELRDTSRATGGVINDAHSYNGAAPGLVVNDAIVTGVEAAVPVDLGNAANSAAGRTMTITPTVLSAAATKDWRRAGNNPSGGADNTSVRDLPLPVGGEPWPSATLTVSARNTSATRVDGLSLHEPSNTTAAYLASTANPFSSFAITDVVGLSDVASVSGATGVQITLSRYDAATEVLSTEIILPTTLLAMDQAALADVVGIEVAYAGRIATGASSRATLVLTTQLLPENRVSDEAATADLVIDNQVRATVSDARVCVDEPGPAADPCDRQPVSDTADDAVTVSDAEVKAFVGKQIDQTTVHRDAGTPIAATLSIQSFGNSAADSLEITDDDARYFNAIGLTGIDLVALPTGAEEAVLEVGLAGAGFTVTADGTYSAPLTWVSADTRTTVGSFALAADATGAPWADVLALRVTFRDTDGNRIVSPGTALGTIRLTGALRSELVSGGLPSATGAGSSWADEVTTNPGEAVAGQVTNMANGQAYRTGFTSGTPTQAGDSIAVLAGAVQVGTTKTAAAGTYGPGDAVDYLIAVSNASSPASGADTLGLVVTDRLPENETLRYDPTDSVWSTTVTPGDDRLGTPTVTHEAGAVTFTWPDGARLAPGQTVNISLRLFVAEQLSSIQVTNTVAVGVTARPVDTSGGGGPGGTTCISPSATDPVTGECVRTASALSLGGPTTFASAKWVSTGDPVPVHTTDPASTCSPRGPGADSTWFRFPCVAQTVAGGAIDWQVEVTSLATAPSDSLTIVDMLPQAGDYSAQSTASRGSAWRPAWDGILPELVAVPGRNTGATLQVWTTTADYRAGGLPGTTAFDPVPGTWTLAAGNLSAAAAAAVTGFRFEVSFPGGSRFVSGQTIRVGWSMDAPTGDASQGSDAWNSFAFRVQPDGNPLPLVSVPLKAGVRYSSPSYAAGDTVWVDRNRDGLQDPGEPGVPDVTVRIYGVDAAGVVATTPRATTTTDAEGRYLFDLLPAGDYVIEFALDAVHAARYKFTMPTIGADLGVDSNAVVGSDLTVGRTARFTLDGGGGNPNMRPVTGADAAQADLIDPTLDAGLIELPVRVGDLIWFDADGDGLQSAGEQGIPGVVLEITDAAGLPVTGIDGRPVGSTATDADGRYLFEELPPGEYIVRIDRVASRTALLGYAPTQTGVGLDRQIDSATWRDTSLVLVGGEQDLSLDFGFVLRDGVGLAISKTAGTVVVGGGDALPRVTWDLVIASTGTDDAYAGFTVSDPMPAGLTAVSAGGEGFLCTVSPVTVTCVHDAALASGATATIRVVTEITAAPGTTVRNIAEVSAAGHPYRSPVPPAQDDGALVVPAQATDGVSGALSATGSQVLGALLAAVLLVSGGVVLIARRKRGMPLPVR